MEWNKKNIVLGIFFLLAAALCAAGWRSRGFAGYYLTGVILFLFISIAFLRRSRRRR